MFSSEYTVFQEQSAKSISGGLHMKEAPLDSPKMRLHISKHLIHFFNDNILKGIIAFSNFCHIYKIYDFKTGSTK